MRDPGIVNFIIDQGVKFVTTSAGDPQKIVAPLKAAGLTVFHVVPSLKTALRAVDCGVDGLVVEGGEGGGFKNPREVSTMVLLPLVCETVKVPVIAAGRHGRRPNHGGGLHARRRGHPDGHPHGLRRRIRPST
ncbi:MAG: nitronate monooxygenase [Rhizomicrobium sp.]